MPKLKKEKLIHIDMDELAQKPSRKSEELSAVSLGMILENARTKKKMTIEDVSNVLRIKTIYLEALEKGQYYAFPARSYAIGFLRNYSKYLKLNPDEMVEKFHQETNDLKEEPLDMLVLEKNFPLPSFKTVMVILMILVFVYILWYIIATFFYPQTLVQKFPEPETPAPVVEEIKEEILPPVIEPVKEEVKPEVKEIKEVSEEVFEAPVAFLAIDRVWVSIKDTKNGKVLIDKTFVKNEHYVPKVPLSDLVVSTGRSGVLDIYIDGQRVKTFSKEENTSLADLMPKD